MINLSIRYELHRSADISESHVKVENFFREYLQSVKRPADTRVKSGNFGHQVNSDIHLQTVEIQMRLMSRLIEILTVCLVNLFLQSGCCQLTGSSDFTLKWLLPVDW